MSNEEDPSGAFRQPSFMRLLLDHMPNQIFWKDRSLRYVGCNQAFAEVVGLDRPEDICGLTDFDFARDDREARNYQADDRAVLETGTPIIEREERYDTADGREGVVHTTKLPIRDGENRIVGLLGICVDVTERKQAEATQTALAERLHQSQKLDAIGQLAGGIAHDFNNMLAGILSASELIQERVSAEDAASLRYLQLIRRSVKHASNLTGQLLSFARRQPADYAPIDVHQVVGEVVELLKNTIDRRVECSTTLKATNPTIRGNHSQLQSAILNLGINASHAISGSGRIHFHTFDGQLTAEDGSNIAALGLDVRDTGSGISDEDLQHIFEPFFTTKSDRQGTGLGLAAVHGTVQQHDGEILVHQTSGSGSTFRLLFPLANGAPGDDSAISAAVTGAGQILLVDDEVILREAGRDLLESLGYDVILAADGQEALDRYTTATRPFDVVLLDVMMPKMSGVECFRALKRMDPAVQVIVISGYSGDMTEEIEALQPAGIVRKPFQLAQVSKLIRRAMGSDRH